jgi:hypothetical protein
MSKIARFFVLIGVYIVSFSNLFGQPNVFKEIILNIDTCSYTKSKNSLAIRNNRFIYFEYKQENEVCRVEFLVDSSSRAHSFKVEESGDYEIVDSVRILNHNYYDFKIKFHNLSASEFLKFRFRYQTDSIRVFSDVNLLPVSVTTARLNHNSEDLSAGEAKVFELISNNVENIVLNPDWQTYQDINYRIIESNHQLFMHIMAASVGKKNLNFSLKLRKPILVEKELKYEIPLNYVFNVKSAGLQYIDPDKSEIFRDKNINEKNMVLFDNSKGIQLNKTYLIYAQEIPGSPLVATLFAKEKLANNKTYCEISTFNFHQQAEGYLYIKDGDEPMFITNFNIVPQTRINKVRIMRNGRDWIDDAFVFPGETISIQIEGESLSKSKIKFDALIELEADSAIRNNQLVEMKLKVPVNVNKKNIDIFCNGQKSGKTLSIKEFQIARPFDYINLLYGGKIKCVNDYKQADLHDKPIRDITISFVPEKIDSGTISGKQYVEVDVKVYNKNNELIDFTTISDIVVCPTAESPRFVYYDRNDCSNTDFALNGRLNGYLYNLKEWSRIKITFKNPKERYGKDIQSKTVEIILQKHYTFDIDVSFPAGLLVRKTGESGIGNFGGVSMAVIAQYSFYDNEKIAKLKPYKIGAGFIALNAFNFNSDKTNRDMGVVIIATLNPMNPNRKLSFPIYFGGGYLLSQKKWFGLLGPGISVQF